MTVHRKLAALGVAAALVLTAGCSSDGDDAGGTDTDADATTTVAPIDEGVGDGGVENTVPPTDQVELPDGFPAELAPPDGVVTLVEATALGGGSFVVKGELAGADVRGVYEGLQAQLTDAGYEVLSPTLTDDGEGGASGGLSAQGPEYTVAATIGPDGTTATDDVYLVLMNVAPVA